MNNDNAIRIIDCIQPGPLSTLFFLTAIFRDLSDLNVFKACNMALLLLVFSKFLQKHIQVSRRLLNVLCDMENRHKSLLHNKIQWWSLEENICVMLELQAKLAAFSLEHSFYLKG